MTRCNRRRLVCITGLCLALLLCSACSALLDPMLYDAPVLPDTLPSYQGESFAVLNNNIPSFSEADLTTDAFETYAPLDEYGRCGVTMACIGRELMPTKERGAIGNVRPSGWHNEKYDFVDGKYVYNRCHLIGFQLTGENANERNLITGTRYLNTEGMLPFENMVADYIRETNHHVMYRVVPVFEGQELVARGVTIEAYSVEDNGDGICFYVYCFNVQPGVSIDYATGTNRPDESTAPTSFADASDGTYILNTSSKKIHLPSCSAVEDTAAHNRRTFTGDPDTLLEKGYDYCGTCFR